MTNITGMTDIKGDPLLMAGGATQFGELVPLGGGDPIPLLKPELSVGRRESSDIVLRFPNVSGRHCELSIVNGYWVVKDLGSSNGTKVNGTRVTEQRLDPGDKLSVARHDFEINYEPGKLGAVEKPAEKPSVADSIFGRSLLEAAGLEGRRPPERRRER
jgi:pSer/pThr/pTyr-binding forkhead associated (FHA) protein